MHRLNEKVAIVTGSVQGIGRAIAQALSDEGARLVINSVKSVDAGTRFARSLPHAIYVQGDVTKPDACETLVQSAIERWGRLDIVVNNAGKSWQIPHSDFAAASSEVFHELFDRNVLSAWHMSRIAFAELQKQNQGTILNISSAAGVRATGSSIPYSVSKAAMNHLTKMLAKAMGPSISINALAPGFIDTPRTDSPSWDGARAYYRANTAVERSGTAEEIAALALGIILCPFTTGQVIVADGGFKLG